jgi:hypothetical protein
MTAIKDAALGGTLVYNGFAFGGDGSTPPTYRLRGSPVYDEAGRAVTHVRYQLEVTTIVYGESEEGCAARMSEVRQRLSRPGRKLEITGLGLGDTVVEREASHPDVVWGAKPRVLALEPVGGTLAWQLHWECEFNVAEPSPAAARAEAWLAFNCETTYALDGDGFTTRTFRGYVHIAATRDKGGDPTARRTADAVRDRLRIAVPAGFRRAKNQWTESADRSRIDFLVVDEELPGDPYPPGIVAADVDYAVETPSLGAGQPLASVSGWMETAPGAPRSLAATRLLAIAQDKLQRLQLAAGPAGHVVLPGRISLKHKLFTRRTWLAIDFHLAGCLPNLLTTSGMWEPVPGSDYRSWRTSVEHLWSARGGAGLNANPADAAIVDILDNPTTRLTVGAGGTARPPAAEHPVLPFLAPIVTPAVSWLEYEIRLRAARRESASVHTLAREVTFSPLGQGEQQGVGPPFKVHGGAGRVREVHGEPIQQVRLEGTALRLKFPPPIPFLTSVGGQPVRERQRVEERSQAASFCGVPAFRAKWSITYDVVGYVGPYAPPSGPLAK